MLATLNSTKGYMSITFDGWSSRKADSYLGVTAHFITEEMKMCNFMVKMINCNDLPHTAANLSDLIQVEILDNIKGLECFCAVTDCAANMIATTDALKLKHIPCIAHRLHSVVTAAILKSKMEPNLIAATNVNPILKKGNKEDPEMIDQNFVNLSSMEYEDLEELRVAEFGEDEIDSTSRETDQNEPANDQTPISVASVIKKCKRITEAFNKSNIMSAMLAKESKNRNLKFSSLTQDCPTRWNSTYYLLQRYNEANDCINVVLGRAKHSDCLTPLVATEMSVLSDIIECLSCFEIATDGLSGQDYVSVSLIIPTVSHLISEMEECHTSRCKTQIGRQFANDLLHFSKSKLLFYETRTCSAIASILDPRFKQDAFTDPTNYRNACLRLRDEVKQLIDIEEAEALELLKKKNSTSTMTTETTSDSTGPETSINSSTADAQSKSKKCGLKGLLKLLDQKRKEKKEKAPQAPASISKISGNSTARACIIVNDYLDERCIKLTECPLNYWKNTYMQKHLQKLARKYLGIPATSVPSESTFSVAGNYVTCKRNRLSPVKVDQLVFIKKNISNVD